MEKWPPLPGDFQVVNEKNKIAIVTLVTPIENFIFDNVSVVGVQKTENLGVEKIICNTVSNTNIRAFIVCGRESVGHNSGQSLLALWKNGIDKEGRIVGATGAIPYLENVDSSVVQRFREQVVHMENMIGIEDPIKIRAKLDELLKKNLTPFEKPPLWVLGMGKRAERKILTSEHKVIVSETISFDPVSFELQVF